MTAKLTKKEQAEREAERRIQRARAAAEKTLVRAVANMERSDESAAADREAWEAACLDAYEAGLTYPEIAATSGKSRVRIDQVLRHERVRRGIPVNTQKESA
jgi:hypothetical protein